MIILHGLLGASRNWVTIGKALKNRFDVHVPDLRNHGNSPHVDSMRWTELMADIKLYLESHALSDVIFIGHSLGGKIAMKFACNYSEWVKKLIVVDIAAKAYPPYYDAEFRAMKRIPPGSLENRREADELLKPLIPDWGMRQFLMTNLVRGEFGLKWQINLEVLHASLQILRQNPMETKDIFKGPSLLITGGRSDFIENKDVDAMHTWFPNLEHCTLPKAGHNVHVDDSEGFLNILDNWI